LRKSTGKQPRPARRKNNERATAQEFWDKRQSGEATHTGVSDFEAAMMDKTGVSRTTIQEWRKTLEKGERLTKTAPT
jgi:hypothetical protein